jgi:uncharacterized delta-60 repeat protein
MKKTILKKHLLFLAICLYSINIFAQDGALDLTFNPGTGANNDVMSTAIQTDGKIIIGGDFTAYNGTTVNRIARLNSDGSLDGSFNTGTGSDQPVKSITIQTDGKIIIGGFFATYSGTTVNNITRLNTGGSLDGSFNTGTGPSGPVMSTAIQTDGKIIIGGSFFNYNGSTANNISRLNTDGSLDGSFNTGTGADSYVYTTAIQTDGKIIIGGLFTAYNGTMANYIAGRAKRPRRPRSARMPRRSLR